MVGAIITSASSLKIPKRFDEPQLFICDHNLGFRPKTYIFVNADERACSFLSHVKMTVSY